MDRYIAVHLVGELLGAGAKTLLHVDGEPPEEFQLRNALDSMIIDDRRVEHEVTGLRTVRLQARRDVLLFDFE
jgi:hypothetical protein